MTSRRDAYLNGKWTRDSATGYNLCMSQENFDQILSSLLERRPFRPFTVELISGNHVEIDHSRALVVRDGVAVCLRPGGVFVWFDHEGVSQVIDDIAEPSR